MIHYRKILELDAKGATQRTIASSAGHSRDKIREVIRRAKVKELTDLTEEMTNHCGFTTALVDFSERRTQVVQNRCNNE